MQRHHIVALTAAGILSASVVADTMVFAATGERTFVTDDAHGNEVTAIAMSLAIGLTLAALFVVVRNEGARFATARRPARFVRRPMEVALAALAVGFVAVSPLLRMIGLDSGPLYDVSGLLAVLLLTALFVAALVLGLAVIGRNPIGIGGTVLSLVGPVIALTVALAFVAPDAASPVFTTVVVLLGIALIGVRAESTVTRDDAPLAASSGTTAS